MSEIGSEATPLKVAVVGTGPSGMFAAGALLAEKDLNVRVDLFDRLAAPYGLVRYGVAPDHQKIKKVSAVFDRTLADDRVRFFGNVAFGRDLTREDLLAHYHQVIYAVGAQGDRALGIPGEDLDGSTSSTEFVNWYNGHPDLADAKYVLDHEEIVVVGIGNVAMDVARILAQRAELLQQTDIADAALEALADNAVKKIHVLARRGPVQAKCTPSELKELGELEGAQIIVDESALELDPSSEKELEDDRSAQKNMELFREFASQEIDDELRQIRFRFLVSPVEILGEDGQVSGVRIEHNELVEKDGWTGPQGTGETEVIPATMVIRAVGYRSKPLEGLPFDERKAVIPNEEGAIVGAGHEREYVVGWVKRGPSGLIGTNKGDAKQTVEKMLDSIPDSVKVEDDVANVLRDRDIRVIDLECWKKIDAAETERGTAAGRPRVKMIRLEEVLEYLSGTGH